MDLTVPSFVEMLKLGEQTGQRLAVRYVERLFLLRAKSPVHAWLAQKRLREAFLCPEPEFKREAALDPDPGFACLMQGFLAGAQASTDDEITRRRALCDLDCIGGIADQLRAASLRGFVAELERWRRS